MIKKFISCLIVFGGVIEILTFHDVVGSYNASKEHSIILKDKTSSKTFRDLLAVPLNSKINRIEINNVRIDHTIAKIIRHYLAQGISEISFSNCELNCSVDDLLVPQTEVESFSFTDSALKADDVISIIENLYPYLIKKLNFKGNSPTLDSEVRMKIGDYISDVFDSCIEI